MESKAYITVAIQLRYDYDTTIHDAFDYDESVRNYDMHSIRLRYDYTIRLYDENCHVHFCLRRIGSRRARYVVVGS